MVLICVRIDLVVTKPHSNSVHVINVYFYGSNLHYAELVLNCLFSGLPSEAMPHEAKRNDRSLRFAWEAGGLEDVASLRLAKRSDVSPRSAAQSI